MVHHIRQQVPCPHCTEHRVLHTHHVGHHKLHTHSERHYVLCTHHIKCQALHTHRAGREVLHIPSKRHWMLCTHHRADTMHTPFSTHTRYTPPRTPGTAYARPATAGTVDTSQAPPQPGQEASLRGGSASESSGPCRPQGAPSSQPQAQQLPPEALGGRKLVDPAAPAPGRARTC